ncbi:3385_t:CDS:10, partial [Entrophospora sp. SA101]
MSKDIVDDTIHEKVLSYLSEYVSKGPELIKIFEEWNILEIIQVQNPQQDYRIIALSIRLLACLLQHDDKDNSSFLESGKSAQAVSKCFNDTSTYVAASSYLYNKLNGMLYDSDSSIDDRLTVLQLIWTLVDSKSNNVLAFLVQSQLLTRLNILLINNNRIVRSRTNDILCSIFEWVPDPILLFRNYSLNINNEDPISEGLIPKNFGILNENGTYKKEKLCKSKVISFKHIIYNSKYHAQMKKSIDTIISILFNPDYNTDQRILKTALGIIPIAIFTKITNDQITDELTSLLIIKNLLLDSKTECRGIMLLLETMQSFILNSTMSKYILSNRHGKDWADAIVFKACDIHWESSERADGSSCGVDFVIGFNLPQMVIEKINDEEAYVRASCLKTIQSIIRCQSSWQYFASKNLHEKITSELPFMMKDSEAFVRRAAMELLISLIVERKYGSMLLLDRNAEIMNPNVIEKIMEDPDFYVRINGCKFLEAVWNHFKKHNDINDELILSTIPDHKKSLIINESSSLLLPTTLIKGNESEFLIDKDTSFFYWLAADRLLITAVEDPSRLVRSEIFDILQRMKMFLEQTIIFDVVKNNKNNVHNDIPSSLSLLARKHLEFYQKICKVDFVRLESNIDTEHLYKEALECNEIIFHVHPDKPCPYVCSNLGQCINWKINYEEYIISYPPILIFELTQRDETLEYMLTACAFSTLPGMAHLESKNITCQTLTVLVAYTLNNPNSFINYSNSRAKKLSSDYNHNIKIPNEENISGIDFNNKYTLISSNDSTKEKKTNNQSKINKSKRKHEVRRSKRIKDKDKKYTETIIITSDDSKVTKPQPQISIPTTPNLPWTLSIPKNM